MSEDNLKANKDTPDTPKPEQEGVQGEAFKPVSEISLEQRFKWIDQRIEHINNIMYFVIIVLLIGFMAAIASYFFFVRDAYNNYAAVVKEYQDDRYLMLRERV